MHRAPGIAGPLQFLPPPREPPNQEGRPAPVGPLLLLQQVSKPAVDILWSHSRSAWLWLIIGPNVVVIECCKDAAYWKNVIRNELAVVWWRHVAKFIYCNSLLKECDRSLESIKEFIVSQRYTLYKHRQVSKRSIKLFHHIKLAFIYSFQVTVIFSKFKTECNVVCFLNSWGFTYPSI